MPEGDTIHRTAQALRRALLGRQLTRVELPRVAPPIPSHGASVDGVSARGKHLVIAMSDGLAVHTHQRMTGSWHLYRPGDRWRRSPRAARVVLGVEGAIAVCFSAPVVEVLTHREVERHPVLRRLGPDLCDPEVDPDEIAQRVERLGEPSRHIGEVLLDQRFASGIGNVYRSELLFLHSLHPTLPVGRLSRAELGALFVTAGELLRHNLSTTRRTTVHGLPAGALWVYGRAGRPCRRCGARVELDSFGEHARTVFWCPSCQPTRSRLLS